MEFNIDLHIHGIYSGAVSSDMFPKLIAKQAQLKGLHGLGTGDILNPKWERIFREETKLINNEYFEYKNVRFILQTEIEDASRVHHLIIFPSISQVEDTRKIFIKKGINLENDGRPKLRIQTKEILEIFSDLDCILGPAHAFTPYTGFYSKYNSLREGYGDNYKKIKFLELGLSADTFMADRISELHEVTFLSNSDAHSPWPNKLGREFNTFDIEEINFEEIKKAIYRIGGRKITRNVGLNPMEGKYHKTRCRSCYTFFEPEEAKTFEWRCPICNGIIKKGVDHRIKELADLPEGKHPEYRPKYIHIIPLNEIISLALKKKNPYTKEVKNLCEKIITEFGTEIRVLLDVDVRDIEKINPDVAKYIDYFRRNMIKYVPGGAGIYGKLVPPNENVEIKVYRGIKQKKLNDF